MVAKAQSLVEECKKLFQSEKNPAALEKLQAAKCEIATFRSNSAIRVEETAEVAAERGVTIAILELGCFISIRARDLNLFDRHVTRLKTFYRDFPELSTQGGGTCILGLNLLHLLASDRRGEFHQELELVPKALRSSPHVEHPVKLERYLMEGNYSKILELAGVLDTVYSIVPKQAQMKIFFGERLAGTVRQRVAESLEKSYKSLEAQVATKMLSLNSVQELQDFARKENEKKKKEQEEDVNMGDATPGMSRGMLSYETRWEVKDGHLHFTSDSGQAMEIPALQVINNTIGYATDLERIV